jgi:hypothetical protein
LAIDAKENSPPLDLAMAQAGITGKLTPADVLDVFPRTKQSFRKGHLVRLKAGTSYQIDLGGDFDTLLRVEDAHQQPLASNDAVSPPHNRNSRLVLTPDRDETYRLIINSAKPRATGSYTLKVQQVIKLGEAKRFVGALIRADPAIKEKLTRQHKVTLTAGVPYVIALESQKFNTVLTLFAPDGKQALARNDDMVPGDNSNSRLDFTPQGTGEYVLAVTSSRPGETGPYTLKVQGYGPRPKTGN